MSSSSLLADLRARLARHHRRSIRLRGYDYTRAGAYFVTICTHNREWVFGDVVDGTMQLNDAGRIVYDTWNDLPTHYSYAELDAVVVMPNHVHGVVVLSDANQRTVGAGFKPAPTNRDESNGNGGPGLRDDGMNRDESNGNGGPGLRDANKCTVGAGFKPAPTNRDNDAAGDNRRSPLSEIVRGFKTFSARRINEMRGTPGLPVWQRNYYEHIIRNADSLHRIRQYIADNPGRWEFDRNSPDITFDYRTASSLGGLATVFPRRCRWRLRS